MPMIDLIFWDDTKDIWWIYLQSMQAYSHIHMDFIYSGFNASVDRICAMLH